MAIYNFSISSPAYRSRVENAGKYISRVCCIQAKKRCFNFSHAVLSCYSSCYRRGKDMKNHCARLSPPSSSSSLVRLTSRTSGNDRPGLARRQSRSRSQESFEEVSESPSPTLPSPLNATISRRCSPLAGEPTDCSSIISVGTATNEDARLLASRGRLRPTDSVRSVVDCALSLAWRSIDAAGVGRIGRASGGNLPLDTSYSGEVQSLVDLEARWYTQATKSLL